MERNSHARASRIMLLKNLNQATSLKLLRCSDMLMIAFPSSDMTRKEIISQEKKKLLDILSFKLNK